MKKCILHLLRMHSDACCREKTNLSNKIINFAANSFKTTVVFTFHVDTDSGCFDIHAYTDFLFSKTMRKKMSIKWNKVHSNHLSTHANSKDLQECTSHCTVIMHTPSHTHISQQTGGLLQKITSMHIHMQSHACNHTHMHTSEAKHTQSPGLTRRVTKHQVLPSTACRVTPSPNLTSDLDDNRLSSPSLLVGKHCILQKPADTQNGVCVFVLMYAHFNVCARYPV